jgi:hypothetical protein
VNAHTLTRSAPRRTRQTIAQDRFWRRRRKLAAILEGELDPHAPLRHRLGFWERIPAANRPAVGESLTQIVMLLRNPAVVISERTLRNVLAFVTEPSSPAYSAYPNQAGFAAHALAAEIRARSAPPIKASAPLRFRGEGRVGPASARGG